MNLFEAIFGFRLVREEDGVDLLGDARSGMACPDQTANARPEAARDALSELGERVQSVVLQYGTPGCVGQWHIAWIGHDGSTGSLSHDSLVVAVVEALRRVILAQEIDVRFAASMNVLPMLGDPR